MITVRFDRFCYSYKMGKASKKIVAEDDEMDEEIEDKVVQQVKLAQVPLPKKKGILKQKLVSHLPRLSTKEHKANIDPKAVLKKVAKQVNLTRPTISLEDKQQIFRKVVGELSSKKVKRRQRKKQHYLIKKNLRGEIEEKLPAKESPKEVEQAMEAELQPVVRKEKFEKDKAIASFKEKMGMGFSSIKQQLLRAKAGQK